MKKFMKAKKNLKFKTKKLNLYIIQIIVSRVYLKFHLIKLNILHFQSLINIKKK